MAQALNCVEGYDFMLINTHGTAGTLVDSAVLTAANETLYAVVNGYRYDSKTLVGLLEQYTAQNRIEGIFDD